MSLLDGILRLLPGELGLGCDPDPTDGRDRFMAELLGATPSVPVRGSVRSQLVRPKNQKRSQSCTGMGASQAFRASLLAAGIECPELSALHNYVLNRATWGGQDVDGGSYVRAAMKAISKFGISTEAIWPFSPLRVNRSPSIGAFHDGYHRRLLEGFYRITTPDEVRATIGLKRAAVVGGFKVGKAFREYDGGVLEAVEPGGSGHALVIEDYLPDDSFGILNSWGTGWGTEGRGRVSEDWIRAGVDLWAVVVRRPS